MRGNIEAGWMLDDDAARITGRVETVEWQTVGITMSQGGDPEIGVALSEQDVTIVGESFTFLVNVPRSELQGPFDDGKVRAELYTFDYQSGLAIDEAFFTIPV